MARDVAGREQKGKEKEASGSTQTPFRATPSQRPFFKVNLHTRERATNGRQCLPKLAKDVVDNLGASSLSFREGLENA